VRSGAVAEPTLKNGRTSNRIAEDQPMASGLIIDRDGRFDVK
jgi:hypothetical protein